MTPKFQELAIKIIDNKKYVVLKQPEISRWLHFRFYDKLSIGREWAFLEKYNEAIIELEDENS